MLHRVSLETLYPEVCRHLPGIIILRTTTTLYPLDQKPLATIWTPIWLVLPHVSSMAGQLTMPRAMFSHLQCKGCQTVATVVCLSPILQSLRLAPKGRAAFDLDQTLGEVWVTRGKGVCKYRRPYRILERSFRPAVVRMIQVLLTQLVLKPVPPSALWALLAGEI